MRDDWCLRQDARYGEGVPCNAFGIDQTPNAPQREPMDRTQSAFAATKVDPAPPSYERRAAVSIADNEAIATLRSSVNDGTVVQALA